MPRFSLRRCKNRNRFGAAVRMNGMPFRYVFALCGFILLSISSPSAAQDAKNVVVLETMTLPFLQGTTSWLRKSLTKMGYSDGVKVKYTVLNADGNFANAQSLLSQAISNQKIDVVVSVATLASRASRTLLDGKDIPQVFAVVADPVGEGFVSEIGAVSGSNITGRTHVVPASAKLSIVSKSLSALTKNKQFRVAILRSTYPSAASDAQQLIASAEQYPTLALKDLAFPYTPGEAGRSEMRRAATKLLIENKLDIDGIWLATGPNQLDAAFIRHIGSHGVPIVFVGSTVGIEQGGLIGLLSSAEINGRSVAGVVASILKGVPARDIPIVRPERFKAGMNLSTAEKMGVIVPVEVLELVGGNVYR